MNEKLTAEQRDWKDRPFGFLEEGIDGFEDERLDYIYELHQKMWELVRKIRPGSSGSLKDNVTVALLTSTEPEDESDDPAIEARNEFERGIVL